MSPHPASTRAWRRSSWTCSRRYRAREGSRSLHRSTSPPARSSTPSTTSTSLQMARLSSRARPLMRPTSSQRSSSSACPRSSTRPITSWQRVSTGASMTSRVRRASRRGTRNASTSLAAPVHTLGAAARAAVLHAPPPCTRTRARGTSSHGRTSCACCLRVSGPSAARHCGTGSSCTCTAASACWQASCGGSSGTTRLTSSRDSRPPSPSLSSGFFSPFLATCSSCPHQRCTCARSSASARTGSRPGSSRSPRRACCRTRSGRRCT
mmetsp:Transcript_2975/g.7847  ORF Transcript_2975/g.7847 Transcript_2975/m.7847 type:complete len:266 (-) Transcript_2975:821-1618(-)